MARSVTPFLMFEGAAEEAMRFYVPLFAGSDVKHVELYKSGEMGPEGTVKRAAFTLAGQDVICIDSPAKHGFTFTPSMSLFVECEDEAEFDNAFAQLSSGGAVMMAPDNYGFSRKFGWLSDRFGVSWQLNLS
ncbi:VOC family protein [Telluria beijingensis]|uniref:VOC family protein n=1 Tax=Telluria beijingensis TaxID=3068633 RepID=UPI002795CC8F|nr:VOC family protein [Massilia sp. REN29]